MLYNILYILYVYACFAKQAISITSLFLVVVAIVGIRLQSKMGWSEFQRVIVASLKNWWRSCLPALYMQMESNNT